MEVLWVGWMNVNLDLFGIEDRDDFCCFSCRGYYVGIYNIIEEFSND